MQSKATVVAVVAALGIAGCGGPVVTVRHQLPPDLPLPAGPKLVRLGEFKVVSGPADSYGEYTAGELAEQFRPMGEYMTVDAFGAEAPDWPRLTISANIHIDAKDTTGKRTIRRLQPTTTQAQPQEVPTLTREVSLRVDFVMLDAAGKQIAAAENRASYDSTKDPRTRGPLGLDRPDDPANVPPTQTVVRELLTACVGSFIRMARPPVESVDVQLRRSFSRAGREGTAALTEGNFHLAMHHLAADVEARPKDLKLLFNLAVAAEGAGELATALKHYRRLQAGRPDDTVVEQAIKRIDRIQARRAGKPAAATQPSK